MRFPVRTFNAMNHWTTEYFDEMFVWNQDLKNEYEALRDVNIPSAVSSCNL